MTSLLPLLVTIILTWQPPATNMDGTPLTDLVGYELGVGITSGDYGIVTPVGNVTRHLRTEDTRRYMAVRAINSQGVRSPWSNEVQVADFIQTPTPSPTPAATPAPTPKPSPTPFTSLSQCQTYVKTQGLVYQDQVKLTAKYLAERNQCRAQLGE